MFKKWNKGILDDRVTFDDDGRPMDVKDKKNVIKSVNTHVETKLKGAKFAVRKGAIKRPSSSMIDTFGIANAAKARLLLSTFGLENQLKRPKNKGKTI